MGPLIAVDYEITSHANPGIKRLASLADLASRDAEGVFVVEGPRLFQRAMSAGLEPVEVYVDGSSAIDHPLAVSVRPDVLDRVSYRKTSQGILGVFPKFATGLELLEPGDPALLAVAEGIEKPGNLGAMLRTIDAVGGDGLIALGPGVDFFNPNVLRSSTGAIFVVGLAESTLEETAEWSRDRGVTLLASDPGADQSLYDIDLTGPVALLIGAEDDGLSRHALSTADEVFRIPMRGTVDSLNASVSLAVVLYEAHRQRIR